MCYIMASNSFKRVMDNSNVHYSFSWGNNNWSIFKINEKLPVFLSKITEKWRAEYDSNMWCNTPPDGCLYAGLWDEVTYNVNGHMMTGFVNEDIAKTPELKARFEEEKYKNLSDWLSRVMQMDTNVSGSDDMSEIGDLYAVITYLAKVNKVGGIKKFLEKYEGESITEDELTKMVYKEDKNAERK